jgi:hypothetical protein
MGHRKLLAPVIVVAWVLCGVVGCSAPPATSELPTRTPTPVPPTATPTQIPPTSTPTPLPGPKAGRWESSIGWFDVKSDGCISDLRILLKFEAPVSCSILVKGIAIEPDGTFVYKVLDPSNPFNRLTEGEKSILKMAGVTTPVPIETDAGEMFEVLRISGKFDSSAAMTGNIWFISCEGKGYFPAQESPWNAEWKNP